MICASCGGNTKKGESGESFIPDEAAAVVEGIVEKAKQLKVEVEVVSYPGCVDRFLRLPL